MFIIRLLIFFLALLNFVLANCILLQAQNKGTIPASAGTWSKTLSTPLAALFNPASLANPIPISVVLQSKQPYLVKGLSELQCYSAIQSGAQSGIFLGCKRFGNPDFSELTFSLGYGMQLKKWLQFGIVLNNLSRRLKGYKRFGTTIPGASLQITSSSFVGGIFLQYEPRSKEIAKNKTWLLGSGIGKDWSDQLYTDLNLGYCKGTGISTQVSLQYQVLSAWSLVLMLHSRPLRYAFETGYTKERFTLRICTEWHPQLGFSPGLFLGYSAKSNKQHEKANIY